MLPSGEHTHNCVSRRPNCVWSALMFTGFDVFFLIFKSLCWKRMLLLDFLCQRRLAGLFCRVEGVRHIISHDFRVEWNWHLLGANNLSYFPSISGAEAVFPKGKCFSVLPVKEPKVAVSGCKCQWFGCPPVPRGAPHSLCLAWPAAVRLATVGPEIKRFNKKKLNGAVVGPMLCD